jgi:putative ABC transport system permease protein
MAFLVTAVFADEPALTHLDFDFIASFSSLEIMKNDPIISQQVPAVLNLETKGFNAFYTYLVLTPGSSSESLVSNFPSFIEDFRGKGRSERLKPTLQSLSSIHLESNHLYEIDQNGSLMVVYTYFFVGCLILLMACINYINISTAEFLNGAKGVALKKILGVRPSMLILSHLTGTALIAFISIVLGCLLGLTFLPKFNLMMDRSVAFFNADTFFILLVLFVLIVTISGLYPAWSITRANPLESFKGNLKPGGFAIGIRHGLVFFQLLISFSLLTVSLLIYHQISFLLQKDLGFNTHALITLNATGTSALQRTDIKNRILSDKNISSAAMCSTPPGESLFTLGITLPENNSDEDRRVTVYQSFVDADYLKTMDVGLRSGRFFNPDNPADSLTYVVVNEAAAKMLGNSPLNRAISIPGIFSSERIEKNVVGIFADFNFASLHNKVEPMMLEYNPDRCRYFLVRFNANAFTDVVASLEKIWKENAPDVPFDHYFMDDRLAILYEADQRQKAVMFGIAATAILLASIGIFGTTLFVVQQRSKEACLRKLLGSAGIGIMILLVRPILIALSLSCMAGIPIIIYAGGDWLARYPYRVEISPVLFVIAFAAILLVIAVTVLYHFVQVTKLNPAQVLRQTS